MRLSVLILPFLLLPQIAASEICGAARSDVAQVQSLLQQNGYDPKGVDGQMGPDTAQAIVAFQSMHGLPVDGRIDPDLLARLRAASQSSSVNSLLALAPPTPRLGFYQRFPWPSRMGGL